MSAVVWVGVRGGCFEHVEAGRAALYVPVLVLVELGELARRGVIELRGGFEVWTWGLLESGRFFAADLTWEVVVRAEALYGVPERTYRLIAATAAVLGKPLVTKDGRIGAAGVEVIW